MDKRQPTEEKSNEPIEALNTRYGRVCKWLTIIRPDRIQEAALELLSTVSQCQSRKPEGLGLEWHV